MDQLILLDTEKFLNMINIFNLADIPGLFFIKFEKILTFEFQINLGEFNNYLKDNPNLIIKSFDSKYDNDDELTYTLKYPKKINDRNIIKSYSHNGLAIYLKDFINFLKKNHKDKLDCSDKDNTNNTNNSDNSDNFLMNSIEDEENDNGKNNKINYNVPVLFNGCDIIKDAIHKLTIKKKMLNEHFEKCNNCEIINNNDKKLKLDKKIFVKRIISKNNFEIFDNIVSSYQNVDRFITNTINTDFVFEENKINIVVCSESKCLYSKCVFVLY